MDAIIFLLIDLPSDGPMPETQLLNVSGNSGHSVTSRRRSRCDSANDHQEEEKSDDDDSSDWDDWDDDEKEASWKKKFCLLDTR
jgi:hypothetical protein